MPHLAPETVGLGRAEAVGRVAQDEPLALQFQQSRFDLRFGQVLQQRRARLQQGHIPEQRPDDGRRLQDTLPLVGQRQLPRLDQPGQSGRQARPLRLGHVHAAPLAEGDDAALHQQAGEGLDVERVATRLGHDEVEQAHRRRRQLAQDVGSHQAAIDGRQRPDRQP